MFLTRWSVIFWLKSNKNKSEKDLGGRNSNYIWLAAVYSYYSRNKHKDPCCFFSLACCNPDLSWCILFTQSQFHDWTFFFFKTPLLSSIGSSVPKAPSPQPLPQSWLFILQWYFWALHWSNVNAIILRGVFSPSPKYEELYNPGALTILKMVLNCGFKDKTDARLQIINERKVKWKVELILFWKLRALALT